MFMTIRLHLLCLGSFTGLEEESNELKECEGCALHLSVYHSVHYLLTCLSIGLSLLSVYFIITIEWFLLYRFGLKIKS